MGSLWKLIKLERCTWSGVSFHQSVLALDVSIYEHAVPWTTPMTKKQPRREGEEEEEEEE